MKLIEKKLKLKSKDKLKTQKVLKHKVPQTI